jgi:hypothetical protein
MKMLLRPELMDCLDATFIEPRMVFDDAIVDFEDMGDYKRIHYNKEKLEKLCLEYYSDKVWYNLRESLERITDGITLI